MSKKDRDPRFQTHIPEPRWQQIISAVVALIAVIVWLILFFKH